MSSASAFPTVAKLTQGDTQFETGLPADVDLQGWNSDHPIFDDLVSEVQPKIVVEVGTWKGRSAMHFAQATQHLATEIFCVDTWLGGIDHVLSNLPQDNRHPDPFGSPRLYHQFLRNFRDTPYAARIHPIQNTSINGARMLRHYSVFADLIYIDGSHEYEDVYADLCAYAPMLAPGGRIFGDDFRSFPGVFTAVLRFAHEQRRKVREVSNNFWILST